MLEDKHLKTVAIIGMNRYSKAWMGNPQIQVQQLMNHSPFRMVSEKNFKFVC